MNARRSIISTFGMIASVALFLSACRTNEKPVATAAADTALYQEPHRPQVHFSPKANWMNDPNGLVFNNGEYHLFYQHYPKDTKWGPMHWGHAVSRDLFHWEHLPIALYPDSLGLIFSGSVVVDKNNTSGFGTKEQPPLVAVFTQHSMEKEKAGKTDYQNQSIAFSVDNGRTWTKYDKNPVLKNQGIKDFRDPKVSWHEESKKWVMTLAVSDHIEFWSSGDLKSWTKLSEFGQGYGAHGGVWECPDLFKLKIEGEEKSKWVLLVSINPGGPNGGSATQYFIGDFDGKTFKPDVEKDVINWVDHGPDDYAGVTYANAPDNRRIFLGWMSNWDYAQDVPTSPWRSAMTAPRDLSLRRIGNQVLVRAVVSPEYLAAAKDIQKIQGLTVADSTLIKEAGDVSQSIITTTLDAKDFVVELWNIAGENVAIGFDQPNNRFYIDRRHSGKKDFSKNYSPIVFAPRIATDNKIKVTLVVDVASVEAFFDDGVTVMTGIFFSNEPLNDLVIQGKNVRVENLTVGKLPSIWRL